MSSEGENSHSDSSYRQSLLLDGEITTEGNILRIPLRCLNCKKEKLEAMFADRFRGEQVRVESTEHPHSTYGSPSSVKMHRMVVEFEPIGTNAAVITKLFVELRDAGVQDLDRSMLSRAFRKLGQTPPGEALLPAKSSQEAGWSAVKNTDDKPSGLRHF